MLIAAQGLPQQEYVLQVESMSITIEALPTIFNLRKRTNSSPSRKRCLDSYRGWLSQSQNIVSCLPFLFVVVYKNM